MRQCHLEKPRKLVPLSPEPSLRCILFRHCGACLPSPRHSLLYPVPMKSQMIYVMLDEMVFRVRDDQLHADDSWRYVLQRHISYFADEDGFRGFLEHIGEENPFYERLIALASAFDKKNPRVPFSSWNYVEPAFRDLVGKMTILDPTKRISTRQALEHCWFG